MLFDKGCQTILLSLTIYSIILSRPVLLPLDIILSLTMYIYEAVETGE